MRNLTIGIVNSRLVGTGITCTQFSKALEPASFECLAGHKWVSTANNILKRGSCPHCSGKARVWLPDVNTRLASRRIVCSDYKDTQTKAKFTCQDGHEWMATPNSVLRGNGCPHCAGRVVEYSDVADILKARGITFESYKGALVKTEFTCRNGHRWKATVDSVKRGHGCPVCAGNQKLTLDLVNKRIEHRGIRCLSYKNKDAKTNFACVCGHTWAARSGNVMNGKGCPKCSRASAAKKLERPLTDEIVSALSHRGIVCTDFASMSRYAMFVCCSGHTWKAQASSVIRQGNGCPKCAKYGFNPAKSASVYLIAGKSDGRMNFGITNRPVLKRKQQHEADDGQKYVLLESAFYYDGATARSVEKSILREIAKLGLKPIAGSLEEFYVDEITAIRIFRMCQLTEHQAQAA